MAPVDEVEVAHASRASGVWKVVGGAAKGGIVVRHGKDTASQEAAERLSHGACVRALLLEGGRMSYELISGSGPATGWVSLAAQGKALLEAAGSSGDDAASEHKANAMQLYGQSFGGKRSGQAKASKPKFGDGRRQFSWMHPVGDKPGAVGWSKAVLPSTGAAGTTLCTLPSKEANRGEKVTRCTYCNLPLGEIAYTTSSSSGVKLHEECGPLAVMQELVKVRASNKAQKEIEKDECRKEFDIGWTPSQIPDSSKIHLQSTRDERGSALHCLTADIKRGVVELSETVEPAAALNLEYLALALRVRLLEGREPLFSLDPVSGSVIDSCCSMQTKRFEPAWLAGTSVGEVMFQADYHLKELSMGEYTQPVLGMKSCLDMSTEKHEAGRWNAREWFVVKEAEMFISEDGVLVPHVAMGVEARQQVVNADGSLEDARITRPDHPLVEYGVAFTHNFELIAERKSAIFHLRELAKASVMAKYLVDAGVTTSGAWLQAADRCVEAAGNRIYCMEVPQIWNDRCSSRIHGQDGKVVQASIRSVYGGVQFGLDRFGLASRAPSLRAAAPMGAIGAFSARAPSLAARAPSLRAAAPMGAIGAFSARAPSLAARAPSLRAAAPMGAIGAFSARAPSLAARAPSLRAAAPMGVDLSLESHNLSSATPAAASSWSKKLRCDDSTSGDLRTAFWEHIDGGAKDAILDTSNIALLRKVFNPQLCDRRMEGQSFLPPQTSHEYVQKLRKLIHEEADVQQQRRSAFLSQQFSPAAPGHLFPLSWTSEFEVTAKPQGDAGQTKFPCDLETYTPLVEHALKDAVPEFDKTSEDKTSYRIYRLGTMEVRTIQEEGAEEEVAAIFALSQRPLLQMAAAGKYPQDTATVQKAVQYVEETPAAVTMMNKDAPGYRYFIELTLSDDCIITVEEMSKIGHLTWQMGCQGDEVRRSLAKKFRTLDSSSCSGTPCAVSFKDVKAMLNAPFTRKMLPIHDVFLAMTRAWRKPGTAK